MRINHLRLGLQDTSAISGGGGGVIPSILTTSTFASDVQVTAHDLTLPAGITAGDFLLVYGRGGSSSSSTLVANTAGWNKLGGNDAAGGCGVFWKIAAGGETTLQLGVTTARRVTALAWRISGASEIEMSAVSLTNDPPSLTPSWGAWNNLVFAFSSHNQSDTAYTAAPSTYLNLLTARSPSSTNFTRCGAAGAHAPLEAGIVYNPSVFTNAGGANFHATTVALRAP